MPKMTVSNQGDSSNPFDIQTICGFHQVMLLDEFFVHARTGHHQRLGFSFQEFQTLPQKVGTENRCLT